MEAEGEAMRTLYVEEVVDTLANGGDPVVAEKYHLEKLGVDAGVKSFRNGSFFWPTIMSATKARSSLLSEPRERSCPMIMYNAHGRAGRD